MAAEDREDEWDSDELEGDDDDWRIPVAPPRLREDNDEDRRVLPFKLARR